MSPAYVDALVVISLMILAIAGLLFASSAQQIIQQAVRTMLAYEKLANTLDAEVPATLHEFKQLAERVNLLSSATTQRVTDVGHKVEEVSGSLGLAAEEAKRQSSVWGSAVWAGVKAYLSSKDRDGNAGQAHPESRQIAQDRGEQNVRQ